MKKVQNYHYICPLPSKFIKMTNRFFYLIAVFAVLTTASSCKMLSGKKKSRSLPNDGQLHGVAPGARWNLKKPVGMVYVPQGTFHMGPSDEDINYAFTARNKSVSVAADSASSVLS